MKTYRALVLLAVLAAGPAYGEDAQTFEPRPSAEQPYPKKAVEADGAKIAYIETGDLEGDPVLFLHGIPTSSYLWRNVLPGLAQPGRRLIAIDLVGFGDSEGKGYGVLEQSGHLAAFVDALGLDGVTLVTHDWGAGIGLIYAAENAGEVKAFAALEGALPPVYPRPDLASFGAAAPLFARMRSPQTRERAVLDDNVWIETIVPNSVAQTIQPGVYEAYRAPFPTPESRRPILDMTMSLPIGGAPAEVTRAYTAAADWWRTTEIPKLVLYAIPGRLQPKRLAEWAEQNLKNVTTAYVGPGVHFVQEDSPRGVARELDAWLEAIEG